MDKFDRLNRETREWNHKNVDRFNPGTRENYPTSYNPYGCYSPNRSRDVDRFNPSTRSNYSTYSAR